MSLCQSAFLSSTLLAGTLFVAPVHGQDFSSGEIEYVDRHIIIARDISHSIENDESRQIARGLAEAFRSKDMHGFLSSGVSYAVTAYNFCGGIHSIETQILRTPEDAVAFSDRVFWDLEEPNPVDLRPCDATYIDLALKKMKELVEQEAAYGFRSIDRAGVVIGDGFNSSNYTTEGDLQRAVYLLGNLQNTVVYGIPVVQKLPEKEAGELVRYFQSYVSTPENAVYISDQGQRIPLKKGTVTPANGHQDVARAALEMFHLGYY